MSDTTPLLRPVRAVTLRLRLQRALDAAATLSLAGLGLAAALVTALKTGAIGQSEALPWLAVASALPALGALLGALRPVQPLLAARLLDRAHDLHDRTASALSFAALPDAERTPFMRAAIDDAAARAATLSAKRALPLRLPRDLVFVAGLLIAVAGLALLEVPTIVTVRRPPARLPTVGLHADDVDAFRSDVREVLDDPELARDVRDAAERFDQLVTDLAERRLDRTEALRRLQQVQQSLEDARRADSDEMRETLAQVAQELARSSQTQAAAEALRESDARRAAQEMRQLAEALRQNPPSQRELERLREALARAAAAQPPAPSETELQRRREEMQRLLQRQREQQAQKQTQPEQERRLLERRRRELQRLERQHADSQEQQRSLERLQREMQQAAQSLEQQDRDQASRSLERSAEELNRMGREQMSEEQRRSLEERLSELRELVRRQREQQAQNGQQGQQGQGGQQQGGQRQGGQGQQQQGQGQQGQGQGQQGQSGQQQGGQRQGGQGQSRMDRFVQRAQGQQGQSGQPGQSGQAGQPGQGGQPGQAGQGGQGQGPGQQGQNGPRVMMPGQGGSAVLEMPGMGTRPGQGAEGAGQGGQGPGAGTGHDETTLDDPTRLSGSRQATRVEGEQSGRGPTRSEVILGAAERGFASHEYERVFVDYESHAEEVIEQDQIPGGYRFYVRRYFQLIRPRDTQP